MRVLVADDELIIRMDLKELLEEEGHDVVAVCKDGDEAVRQARTLKPDVALLDIKMPQKSGIEVAKVLADENICPVVLLTAFNDPKLVKQAATSRVYGYLTKPFNRNEIGPTLFMAAAQFETLQHSQTEVEKLTGQLEARRSVERAKGILQQTLGLNEDDAYKRIQNLAMDQRKTMKEIADAILLYHGLKKTQ